MGVSGGRVDVDGVGVVGKGRLARGGLRRRLCLAVALVLAIVLVGMLLPHPVVMPVDGASARDWNRNSYWFEPWGASGVHKGIDIFAAKGTPVVATTYGLVVYAGNLGSGGRVVLMLGPRWRLHYFAHLDSAAVDRWEWLGVADSVGAVGDSGNAVGKAPHLHYSVLSLVPYPWRMTKATQGWKRAFYLDPGEMLDAAKDRA